MLWYYVKKSIQFNNLSYILNKISKYNLYYSLSYNYCKVYKYTEEVIERSPDIEEVKPEKAANKKGRRRIYREEQAIS